MSMSSGTPLDRPAGSETPGRRRREIPRTRRWEE
jgi:hypothetical protein